MSFSLFFYIFNMNDFNMVNVDTHSQIGKSIDAIKIKHLRMDLRDFQQLLPALKQLQNDSNKIVKQFNQYQSKKERKSSSLPYNIIRKFQTLKNAFLQSSKILTHQTRIYNTNVCNRDNEKLHDQFFFKKTLKSYDEKRKWMKNYILKHEGKMQEVEEEVKKNVDYQVHQFTEFRNDLDIERLQHNLEDKLDSIKENVGLLIKNNRMRDLIKLKLASVYKKRNFQPCKKQQIQSKQQPIQIKDKPPANNQLFRIPNYSSFLYFYQSKQNLKNEFLLSQTITLKKQNKKLSHCNEQLKITLDKMQQKIQFLNIETVIILKQFQHDNGYIKDKLERLVELKRDKITKTDYFIYLKEIQRHCNQIIQVYGYYFQYSLRNDKFAQRKESKSAVKVYQGRELSKQIQQIFNKRIKRQFQEYIKQMKQKSIPDVDNSRKSANQIINASIEQGKCSSS